MSNRCNGFTLIELIIVVAIIGVLASLVISAYQTYTVRAQVSEGVSFASAAKAPIVDAYTSNQAPPATRVEAGLSPDPMDSQGNYVTQVAVVNGRIDITFGNQAHQDIQTKTLSLTPYVAPDNTVVWRCGNAPAPAGDPLSGGGLTATYIASTVDSRYLPATCR